MNTFLKILTLLAATAGIVLLVMKFLETDKRRTDDKKHIAMIKNRMSGPIRKNRKADSDEIADFRNSDDDEDAYLFEDLSTGNDDDKYADIFDDSIIDEVGEAFDDNMNSIIDKIEDVVEDIADDAAEAAADEDADDISEDSLAQLLDSDA